jgi:hypothetical protein
VVEAILAENISLDVPILCTQLRIFLGYGGPFGGLDTVVNRLTEHGFPQLAG